MKRKYSILILLFLMFFGFSVSAQVKIEREYRILKSQFPEKALGYIQEKLVDAKRIRFYRETDSAKVNYAAKFKKDRLWYNIEFDQTGTPEEIGIQIKPVDIPEEAFEAMNVYLKRNFKKYKIRKIQQQYPFSQEEITEITIKNAFQNLMIPSNTYELIVDGRKEKRSNQYEVLFDAEGSLKSIQKSLPPNYDHVRY